MGGAPAVVERGQAVDADHRAVIRGYRERVDAREGPVAFAREVFSAQSARRGKGARRQVQGGGQGQGRGNDGEERSLDAGILADINASIACRDHPVSFTHRVGASMQPSRSSASHLLTSHSQGCDVLPILGVATATCQIVVRHAPCNRRVVLSS